MTVFSDLLILHHVQKFSELLISYILVMFHVDYRCLAMEEVEDVGEVLHHPHHHP